MEIDKHSYLEKGYAVTEGVFSASELDFLRGVVEKLEERALSGMEPELTAQCVRERDLPTRKRGGVELDRQQNAAFIIGDPTRFAPELLPFLTKPVLVDLVADLLGTTDLIFHFANVTSKAPHIGSGISWHRDFPNNYISPVEPKMLRTMICLDGEHNGATVFLPGSHRTADDEGAVGEEGRATSAVCTAGSVVAIHPLVLHGGAPNHSSEPRRNIVIQWGCNGVSISTNARESLTGMTIEEARSSFQVSKIGASYTATRFR
ncbi:phytanoyl-CoA dioxygenase family protein [Ensifer sp. NPDC090286]|uniref:phytanoyl-CoA dioxygenase family protein n=1 Tax=Ensifer sp. NPDC090286 TaxID=3363991 RepID=UPI00383B0BDA